MPAEPTIPETITVHLGRPADKNAENVTLPFPDYIKNVASSELYPTWPEEALRANIYAIISYTLNRVYTEWYPSQGYNFDITSSIQYDHSFFKDRDIFEPISRIVDEIFNDYIRRRGAVEPLYAVYCDGREVNCGGLTQWGSVDLAKKGYTPYKILTYFYGDNIDIVQDAKISPNISSYPGTPLKLGSGGNDVTRIQTQLNRISRNYPAIPKIEPTGTVYDKATENAVKKFQEVFGLSVTGVVNKSTWYKINYIYASVKKLSQLNSEGLTLKELSRQFPETALEPGAKGAAVSYLQYYLEVIGAYYSSVTPVDVTGVYGSATENSVKSFQRVFGLPETGKVDRRTWDDIYRAYAGIVENVPINLNSENAALYPGVILTEGMTSEYVKVLQQFLSYIHKTYPDIPDVSATGYFGPVTKSAVTAYQKRFGLTQNGSVGAQTWDSISDTYYTLRYGSPRSPGQSPGYIIT